MKTNINKWKYKTEIDAFRHLPNQNACWTSLFTAPVRSGSTSHKINERRLEIAMKYFQFYFTEVSKYSVTVITQLGSFPRGSQEATRREFFQSRSRCYVNSPGGTPAFSSLVCVKPGITCLRYPSRPRSLQGMCSLRATPLSCSITLAFTLSVSI